MSPLPTATARSALALKATSYRHSHNEQITLPKLCPATALCAMLFRQTYGQIKPELQTCSARIARSPVTGDGNEPQPNYNFRHHPKREEGGLLMPASRTTGPKFQLSLRAVIILLIALIAGIMTTALLSTAGIAFAHATLCGIGTTAAAIPYLDKIIE